jgi:mannobiose 2-epimerase
LAFNELRAVTAEFRQNLEQSILCFWTEHGIDHTHGGVFGWLDRQGNPIAPATKSLVQQSRVLWTFSAASQLDPKPIYKEVADRSLEFLLSHLRDRKHGGFYWLVERDGRLNSAKKHLYGQAFAIYGLAAYANAFHDKTAYVYALELFELIEWKAHDRRNGGYQEAFTQDWILNRGDTALGPPGLKTMNTHTHLLEAFIELYSVRENSMVRERVTELLTLFPEKIIDKRVYSARLYFTDKWKSVGSQNSSYGHDVELSWLMTYAAVVLGKSHDGVVRSAALGLIVHTLRYGSDRANSGVYYDGPSKGPATNIAKVWWVQAEALVGLLNAFQLTGELDYLTEFIQHAKFVRDHMFDHQYGEWLHTLGCDGVIRGEKAGEWRDPYHQSRACLEIVKRTKILTRKMPIGSA